MAQPRISIVVPVYNGASYIVAHLNNFLEQDYSNYEIVVIDDGSTDQTGDLVAAEIHDERLRVIQTVNGGMSVARNTGIAEATGDLITFVDADDWIAPWYLKRLVAPIVADPRLMMTIGRFVSVSEHDTPALNDADAATVVSAADALQTLLRQESGNDVSVWGKLYQKALFATEKFRPGMVLEDFELLLRLFTGILANAQVALVHAEVYAYVQRPGSIMHRTMTDGEYDSIMGIVQKYGPIFNGLAEPLDQAYQTKVISTLAGVYSRAVIDHYDADKQHQLATALHGLALTYHAGARSTKKTRLIVAICKLGIAGQRLILPLVYRLAKRVA